MPALRKVRTNLSTNIENGPKRLLPDPFPPGLRSCLQVGPKMGPCGVSQSLRQAFSEAQKWTLWASKGTTALPKPLFSNGFLMISCACVAQTAHQSVRKHRKWFKKNVPGPAPAEWDPASKWVPKWVPEDSLKYCCVAVAQQRPFSNALWEAQQRMLWLSKAPQDCPNRGFLRFSNDFV